MTAQAPNRIELEQIAREAILVLYASLNGEIVAEASTWAVRDAAFWPQVGQVDPQVQVEPIQGSNFYVGHVPTLITAPVDKYPNCAVYAFSASPKMDDDSDEAEIYDIGLSVELMCKSVKDEQEVNSRIQRTVEAARAVLEKSRTLGGFLSAPMYHTPTVTTGEVFVRREDRSRGDRWFWQGGRLEYRLEKYVQY